jgi:hypothetical protein
LGSSLSSRRALARPQALGKDEYRVIVVFTLIPPDGEAFTCQSNPSTRIQVELRESLGDRELIDGARAPWQDVREGTSS